jgi:hypothetical protein
MSNPIGNVKTISAVTIDIYERSVAHTHDHTHAHTHTHAPQLVVSDHYKNNVPPCSTPNYNIPICIAIYLV